MCTQRSYLRAPSICPGYKVNYFENLLMIDLLDLGRLCSMEHHIAAENIGTNTFKHLLPNDSSSRRKWESLKSSIQSFGPLASEFGYYSLVHAFAETGRDNLIRHLVYRKVNIDQKDHYGRTPIFIAVEEGHEAVIKLLIDNGADVDIQSPGGKTPLVIAVLNGRVNVLRLLLGNGADVTPWKPMHLAAKHGHLEAIRALKEAGADVAAKNDDGATPMHLAASNGHVDAIKALKEAGADVSAKDNRWMDADASGGTERTCRCDQSIEGSRSGCFGQE